MRFAEDSTRAVILQEDGAPLCYAEPDAEYNARLDAQRVTLEMRSKSPRRVDGGRLPMDESPLFGGRKQADLFGEDSGL